jgi:glycosyltransferase involved in cell wall biosynthesis
VNDGSSDGSDVVLRDLGCDMISLDHNRGYGGAIKTGILNCSSEYVAIIDADGTYDPEDIPRLYPHLKECDMVVGQRPKEKGLRRLAKGFLQSTASYAVDYPIPDINSGLRIFRRDLALRLLPILPNGFSLTSTITVGSLSAMYRVRYVPIPYSDRTGKSKIKPVSALFNFTLLILRTMVAFNPLKFFLPPSLAMAVCGSFFLARDLWAGDLAQGSILLITNAILLFGVGLVAEAIRLRH